MAKGVTVWFTGLSCAGKTTIARNVLATLKDRGVYTEHLDGDIVRQSLTRDLGFSKEDRDKNIERVTFVAKLLTRNGVVTLSSFISPYRAERANSRREIGEFLEVYVEAPLETLVERDVKGLYKKAIAGEIKNFTGVNDPYEIPEHADLVCHTGQETVEQSADAVVALLESRGYIPAALAAGQGRAEFSTRTAGEITGPSIPHGGVLLDRELDAAARAEALARIHELPQIALDERELADLEMIGTGALSPLTGFMRRPDYECVVESMRLSDGLVWPLPITLSVSQEQADALDENQEIALVDGAGSVVGLMQVTDRFSYDKQREAEKVFGTTDAAHPGVERLYAQGDVLLGGPVWVITRPGLNEFGSYRLTPRETRAQIDARGWKSVVGFQTRNPIHRAHEYLQKTALEMVDGLLVHPLVGSTKADDVSAEVRMLTYEKILQTYYPMDRTLLAVFPAAMRYAGPREAIFHALCRKNYGCTHFIVGRDHAGVGTYYGTYEAQEIFDQFTPEELGILPLKFEHSFFCRACGHMGTTKTCPHGKEHHVFLSGTKVREMLQAGEMPPPEFTRPETAELLIQAMRVPAAAASPVKSEAEVAAR